MKNNHTNPATKKLDIGCVHDLRNLSKIVKVVLMPVLNCSIVLWDCNHGSKALR